MEEEGTTKNKEQGRCHQPGWSGFDLTTY